MTLFDYNGGELIRNLKIMNAMIRFTGLRRSTCAKASVGIAADLSNIMLHHFME